MNLIRFLSRASSVPARVADDAWTIVLEGRAVPILYESEHRQAERDQFRDAVT